MRFVSIALIMIVLILTGSVITACEPATKLTVDNRMATQLTIIQEGIGEEGTRFDPVTLGIVPAGQTVELPTLIPLRRGFIGWTVLLKAEDPSGNIVWQKKWTFDEFLRLEEVGWKIVVSPETNSQN